MGAATNFGKSDLGINSPTHRNTHAEEDLFQSSDDNNIMNNNIIRNELLEDMFKTCTTPSPTTTGINNHRKNNDNHPSDSEFNPREDESQEFGDFESAFGDATNATAAAASTIKSNIILSETKNNDFDFAAAFGNNTVAAAAPATNLTNSNNLIFSTSSSNSSVPMFGQAIPSTNLLANSNSLLNNHQQQQPAADLLSDFGGLNLASPMVDGE